MSRQLRRPVILAGRHIFGNASHEYDVSALLHKGLQPHHRILAQGQAVRHQYHVIPHFSCGKSLFSLRKLLQQGFRDIVKILQPIQQPFYQAVEFFFHRLPVCIGGFLTSPLQPVRLYRMYHAYTYHGLSSDKRRIHSGKIILNQLIFLKPGGLIADTGRIIPFRFSLHGNPG